MAVPVVVLLVCAAVLPYLATGLETRQEVQYGNIVAGSDNVDSGISQELFHRQTLATTDNAATAITFPVSPLDGGNVVSPSIAQTSSDTVTATSTGLFDSNYQFVPGVNYGAQPVGFGQFGKASPVTTASFFSNSIMYPEMDVAGNLPPGGPTMTLPPVQSGNAYDLVGGLTTAEESQGLSGLDARAAGEPVVLSSYNFDFDASPALIDRAGIVDRLWRNVKQGSVLDLAYEGSAAYPKWIAPVQNPLSLIDCGNELDAIRNAMAMTQPGTFLTPYFWNL